jgi:hypothetical protein
MLRHEAASHRYSWNHVYCGGMPSSSEEAASSILQDVFERLEVRRVEAELNQAPSNVAARSSLAQDDARLDPYQMSHALTGALLVADDHLLAVRDLLIGDEGQPGRLHLYAPCTLLRGAVEGAATAYWLIEHKSRQERLLRRLQLEATNMRDGANFLASAGIPDQSPRPLEDRLGQLRQIAADNRLPADQATAHVTMTRIVRSARRTNQERLSVKACWEAMSGFAHGRQWAALGFLERDIVGTDDEHVVTLRLTNRLATVAWAASVANEVVYLTEKVRRARSRAH